MALSSILTSITFIKALCSSTASLSPAATNLSSFADSDLSSDLALARALAFTASFSASAFTPSFAAVSFSASLLASNAFLATAASAIFCKSLARATEAFIFFSANASFSACFFIAEVSFVTGPLSCVGLWLLPGSMRFETVPFKAAFAAAESLLMTTPLPLILLLGIFRSNIRALALISCARPAAVFSSPPGVFPFDSLAFSILTSPAALFFMAVVTWADCSFDAIIAVRA